MDRQEEIALLGELVDLHAEGQTYQDLDVVRSPVSRYIDEGRFEQEREKLFIGYPVVAAHHSELGNPNDFVTRDIFGKSVLLTRDKDGAVRAFLNVCRHRGARLVNEDSGCKKMFSCPYHAWTYTNTGALKAVPHETQGFPDLDKKAHGLRPLAVAEHSGLIWVLPSPAEDTDLKALFPEFFEGLTNLLGWLDLSGHKIAQQTTLECAANWKILVEGGIEAYHFKVAHRKTIGPHFMNNLSSYQVHGVNIQSVLPREALAKMGKMPETEWDIRAYSNIIYSLFPLNQLLVMQDHIAWINATPLSADRTKLQLTSLVPISGPMAADDAHWKTNHDITVTTLKEDFVIGEAIQQGLSSGANEDLLFGRFEGALDKFNQIVDDHLRSS